MSLKVENSTFLKKMSEPNSLKGFELAFSKEGHVVIEKTGNIVSNFFGTLVTSNRTLLNISAGVLQSIANGESFLTTSFNPQQLDILITNLNTAKTQLEKKASSETAKIIDAHFQTAIRKINELKQNQAPKRSLLSYASYLTTPLSYVTIKPLALAYNFFCYLIPKGNAADVKDQAPSRLKSLAKATLNGCFHIYRFACDKLYQQNQNPAPAPATSADLLKSLLIESPGPRNPLFGDENLDQALDAAWVKNYPKELFQRNNSLFMPLLSDLLFALTLQPLQLKEREAKLDATTKQLKKDLKSLHSEASSLKKKIESINTSQSAKEIKELAMSGAKQKMALLEARKKELERHQANIPLAQKSLHTDMSELRQARMSLSKQITEIINLLAHPSERSIARDKLSELVTSIVAEQDKFDPEIFRMMSTSAQSMYEALSIELQIPMLNPQAILSLRQQQKTAPSKIERTRVIKEKIPSILDDLLFTLNITPRWLDKRETDLRNARQNFIEGSSTLKLDISAFRRETDAEFPKASQQQLPELREKMRKKSEEFAEKGEALKALDSAIKSQTATFEQDKAKLQAVREELTGRMMEIQNSLTEPHSREIAREQASELVTRLVVEQEIFDPETFKMMEKTAQTIYVTLSLALQV